MEADCDYTGEDLRQFRSLVRALEEGKDVNTGWALPFVVRGWLAVIDDNPGWVLTDLGRNVLGC